MMLRVLPRFNDLAEDASATLRLQGLLCASLHESHFVAPLVTPLALRATTVSRCTLASWATAEELVCIFIS